MSTLRSCLMSCARSLSLEMCSHGARSWTMSLALARAKHNLLVEHPALRPGVLLVYNHLAKKNILLTEETLWSAA